MKSETSFCSPVMFGSAMGKNLERMCLMVAVLLHHHNGQCTSTRSTPMRASCDAKCTYSEATRRADCDNRQLNEVPMECNTASYLSLSHNQITRIEHGSFEGFSDLQVLILSNNKIRQVAANAFTGAPQLKEINLQSNNLEMFDRLALNGSNSELRDIYLSYNNIKAIETGTFQFVIKLEFIALYNNTLSSLSPGVFDNLRHLKVLDLGCNKLKILPSEIFTHLRRLQTIILSDNQLISTGRVLLLPRITTLDMRNNNLTRLEDLTEEALGSLEVFLLEGNPWNCDCQLETLRLWYSRLHSEGDHRAYIDSPTCYEPQSLTQQPINGVREGFCLHANFSSMTTDSSKSTKRSSDEINNFTSPVSSILNSPGKSYRKVILLVTLIIVALTLVCISCALKYICNWNCKHNSRSSSKTTNEQQFTHPDSASFPQREHETRKNTLVRSRSVEGTVLELAIRENEQLYITNECTPMIDYSVEGADDEDAMCKKEQRSNEITPTKNNRVEGTAVNAGKMPPLSSCCASEEIDKARKQLSF